MSDTPKRAISPGDTTEDTAKRAKFEPEPKPIENLTYPHNRPGNETIPPVISKMGLKPILPVMPPSLELVTGVKADLRARKGFVGQEEVGILGYAGDPAFKGVRGVIKQRFTDFLVNEVGLDGEVLRLKSIGKPVDPYDAPKDRSKGKEKEEKKENEETKPESEVAAPAEIKEDAAPGEAKEEVAEEKKEDEPENNDDLPEPLRFETLPLWNATTTRTLRPIFSDECITKLHALLVEGKEPPPKVDSGWGSRKARVEVASGNEEAAMNVDGMREEEAPAPPSMYGDRGGGRGQGRDRGRGRGGRGGRGGGRAGDNGQWQNATKDDREVLSQQMTREDRTKAHQIIREVFKGTFETSAKEIPGEENQRIALKWSKGGPATRRPEKPKDTSDRPKPPPYIHFTLHKTNRDTQDCLSHLSRALNCKPQDLTVCGTKDKRAVTVQRVCYKRNGKNLVGFWRSANGIRPGRRTEQQAVEERGERGCRVGDVAYSDKYLELGMLKGNNFAITLRSVQSEATRAEIDAHLLDIRTKGFVNFYGMQRFGTSTVPTHITGLFILQSKWSEAVDSILSLREGEHPECMRARLAWLEDEDIESALQLMPRRCVAERSIWEHWRRSDRKDKLGALGTIPRNLRTMYVHAYQSYIWNLVTSERIKLSSTQPLVGDLVFADKSADDEVVDETAKGWRPSHETSSSQEVKQLTEEDLANYTIHDVIMPLPGWNIDYPAGDIGELYTKILKEDGLDPKRMQRDQREYSLPGSYRKIIHLPKTFTWSHVSYTDPDISLVQSDEDKILGENPAAEDDPEGKFQALKIELTLGPSAYATMALREITREETSTWHQIGLTMKGEDQEFKGASGPANGAGDEGVDGSKPEDEAKTGEEMKTE